jgi:hypothetical protein
MESVNLEVIVDGDGHLVEDLEAIALRMPPEFMGRAAGSSLARLFPPIDHLHAASPVATPAGSFARVGVEGWLEFMSDVGIEAAVLYPSAGLAYGKIVNRDWAIAVCRAYNDWLHETYQQRSPRFKGMGLIPMQEPQAAAHELRRIVTELGMCGAMLPATGLSNHLGAQEFWPVYAEADRLGCCLGVHGGAHSGLGFDYMNVYAPVHAIGHPFGQAISFAGVIFNGVLDKFPRLRMGFLEAGVAWFLMCLERFNRSYETHIHQDPRGELIRLEPEEKVSDYILRHVKAGQIFIGCEGHEPDLAHAVKTVGSGPFLFSSDFPHEVNSGICKEEVRELLDSDELSASDKAAILHGNAERFYNLAPGAA